MRKVKWIWVYGEFEIYHHMLLHCRRVQQNYDFPTMWRVVRPELKEWFANAIPFSITQSCMQSRTAHG